jgi:hypothetical protein
MPLSQPARKTPFPLCAFCNEPLDFETAKTDGYGQAVHEECYLQKIDPKQAGKRDKKP